MWLLQEKDVNEDLRQDVCNRFDRIKAIDPQYVTVAELARAAGVDRSLLTRWLKGDKENAGTAWISRIYEGLRAMEDELKG